MTAAVKLKDACSLEEVMTNLDTVFKSKDIFFANQGPYSQTMVFPVVGYGSESWTIKKAECLRTDAFKSW